MFTLSLLAMALSSTVTAAIVWLTIRYADNLGLVQQTNNRSSHSRPTPTGGGIGIIIGTLAASASVVIDQQILFIALALAVCLGVTGLLDDLFDLSPWLRLPIQFVSVGVLLIITGASHQIIESTEINHTVIMVIFMTFLGSWWINLFNFQDGIDGFAACQTIFMLTAYPILAISGGVQIENEPLLWLTLVAVASTAGFLVLNWPPAQIFMGDAGSMFLGFLILAVAILSVRSGWLSLWQSAIVAVVFAADATVTLSHRIFRGKRITEPHREHAYQHLARRWGGHRPVTLALIGLNLVAVLPLAWVAGKWPQFAVAITIGSYTLASIGALRLGSGRSADAHDHADA